MKLPSPTRLRAYLAHGGIIAYPTEYCYGLGCNPRHLGALKKLLHLKKRPQHKGLIVIGSDLKQLQPLLFRLPENTKKALSHTWPAAKTFVLPAKATILPHLRGHRRNCLAVRIPDHKGARQLCTLAKMPLVSTSCNHAKGKPCRTAREVRRLFGKRVWLISGQTGKRQRPSEIIDWYNGAILR